MMNADLVCLLDFLNSNTAIYSNFLKKEFLTKGKSFLYLPNPNKK